MRRGLRLLGRGLLFSVLGLFLLVMLALGSVNLPPVSRWVAGKVNAALEGTLSGTLTLERLGLLHLAGISNVEVLVRDPEQRPVLRARDIDVGVSWLELARSALRGGSSPLVVRVHRVHIDAVELQLIDDGNGTPTLAHAFEPPESSDPDPEEQGRPFELSIADIRVDLVQIRGKLATPGVVDADLRDLRAELALDESATRIELREVTLEARQLPSIDTLAGRLEGEVKLPAAPVKTASGVSRSNEPDTQVYALQAAPAPLRIRAAFDGQISGRDPLRLSGGMAGDQLEAELALDAVSPETLRLVGLETRAAARVSARASGALDDLGFETAVRLAENRLSAWGRFRRDEERSRVNASLEAKDVNLADWLASAPNTSVFLEADANVELGSRATRIDYRASSRGSSIADQILPAATVKGDATLPGAEPARFSGVLAIEEPGAPLELRYSVLAREDGALVDVAAESRFTRPPRLATLVEGLSVSGSLLAELHLDLTRGLLRAHGDVQLRELHHPQFRAGRGALTLSALGTLVAPELEVEADLRRVLALGRALPRLELQARGRPEQLDVQASAQLEGRRRVRAKTTVVRAPDGATRLEPVALSVSSPAGNLKVGARRVVFSPGGRLELGGLTATGPGRLQASYSRAPGGTFAVEFETEDLDSGKVADIVGIDVPLRLKDVSLTGSLDTRRRSGKLTGRIAGIDLERLTGSLDTDLSLVSGRLSGTAELSLAKAGSARLTARELRVPLPPASERELEALAGEVEIAGDLDLAQLEPMLPLLGVERTSGELRFDVALRRPPGSGEIPTLRAHVTTRSLLLVGERADVPPEPDAEQAKRAAPWSLRGIDIDVNAELAPGEASLDVQLFDREGALLHAQADWKELGGNGGLGALPRALARAPLTGRVQVPRRVLEELPATIRPTHLEGVASARVDISGNLEKPNIEGRARVERFRPLLEQGRGPRGLDVEAALSYRQEGGRLRLDAHDQHQTLVRLISNWQGDMRELATTSPAPNSSARPVIDLAVDLAQFPLELVPELQNRQIGGALSGTIRLEQLGRDAELSLDLTGRNMELNRLPFNTLNARARAGGGKLELETTLRGQAGAAHLQVQSGLAWAERLVPELEGAIQGQLDADKFRLGALLPLMGGAVSELDGALDAHLRATLDGGVPQLSGRAHLTRGSVHIPSVGQRFNDIRADLELTPDSLRIENVSARGVAGGLTASADARLAGLTPVSARAQIRIEEDDKLPLTIEGETIGDAWGVIEAEYQHREDTRINEVRVDLKRLSVELPNSPPRDIQSLEPHEHIRVGYRSDDGFVPVPLQPIPDDASAPAGSEPAARETVVVVDIGAVEIEKGQQAEVVLGGQVQATLGEELEVEGRVEARRGWLDISGKQFDIERATVTFTGEASDPTINAVARYDSPAGYVVYAEYTGTVSRGKLRLRSEPSLSEDEILTLLLFGTPDGSFGAGGEGDSLSTAVSVAGSTAAQGLNRALSSVTELDVSTRIDTSTGSPRPELVVQLSPRVTARVTQALGEPAPGQSPDRTFFTIELRLASAWALSAMVGDRGASALDLIWRRRY